MDYEIYNEDCIPCMAKRIAPGSVDLVVTSIPFGALFMYSGKTEDVGNNADGTDMQAGQFGLHSRYVAAGLFRALKPGHILCIHIQQLLRYKNQHGYIGRRDFRGAVIDLFGAACTPEGWGKGIAASAGHGFEYVGEFVIPKNPQVIAQRLSLHSLQFKTGRTNARNLAPAVNDYVLVFKKPGEAAVPVPAIFDERRNKQGWLSQEDWIRDAHGVWGDIRETDVLEGYKQGSKESEEEKHVCPLQLEVIRRCIRLWSNPGELVFDPFGGIGSTPYVAIEQGRRAIACELKTSYYEKALRYLAGQKKKAEADAVDLFTATEKAVAE